MAQPRITLDQWRALVAVVDAGGYAKAAQAIHLSQSTLSYAVGRIEHLLGVRVFDTSGRRSVLTDAGRTLYRRGKSLLEDATRLEQTAAAISQGWEPEIRIAVDVVFPTWLLLQCFAKFAEEHPDTRIDLLETVLTGTEQALLGGDADLGIGSIVPPGLVGDPIEHVHFACVASPRHPLHQLGRELTRDDLRRHRHLVIRDSGSQRRDAGWLNETRWTVSNKATSIRAVVMGLGFAWLPEENIREELRAGTLAPLPLREGGARIATLYLMFADPESAGPGARRLAQILRENTQLG